jgi:large subunit ribosomal protein L15
MAKSASLKSITVDTLIEAGFVNKNDRVKILGSGTLSVALEVTAHAFSKTAVAAIEAQGGKVTKL